MQTFAVAEIVDVVGDVDFGLGVIGVISLPNSLHLYVKEEAFGHCVIPAIACAAHAADEAMGA